MKEFSVLMALVDFIPVIFFLLAGIIISKDLRHRMSIASLILVNAGIFVSVAAGTLKALYKLLYAAGAGEFSWMSNQFFSNQAFGFLLFGIGLTIITAGSNKKNKKVYSFLPTMALVGIMVVGLASMDAPLCFISSKLKKQGAMVCFIVSFFLSLCMGYLSSRNFDKASMNWIAQGINICGQGLFFVGARILHKAGLEDW